MPGAIIQTESKSQSDISVHAQRATLNNVVRTEEVKEAHSALRLQSRLACFHTVTDAGEGAGEGAGEAIEMCLS